MRDKCGVDNVALPDQYSSLLVSDNLWDLLDKDPHDQIKDRMNALHQEVSQNEKPWMSAHSFASYSSTILSVFVLSFSFRSILFEHTNMTGFEPSDSFLICSSDFISASHRAKDSKDSLLVASNTSKMPWASL